MVESIGKGWLKTFGWEKKETNTKLELTEPCSIQLKRRNPPITNTFHGQRYILTFRGRSERTTCARDEDNTWIFQYTVKDACYDEYTTSKTKERTWICNLLKKWLISSWNEGSWTNYKQDIHMYKIGTSHDGLTNHKVKKNLLNTSIKFYMNCKFGGTADMWRKVSLAALVEPASVET